MRGKDIKDMCQIKKPTVSVLLSTYNGHQYIRELVDSVLVQEDVDLKLQVRDDGSSDDTIEILKSYNDPRISLRTGDNLKPALSFLTLLRECEDSDYYAYCDQDDYWYPNKLKSAIEMLKDYHEAALFISTYDVCDENLNKMFTFNMKFEDPLRLQDVLLYRSPSACNMVFNHALREEINKSNPHFIRMHDFWTLIVTLSHDYAIITSNKPLIKYRQHVGECVGITPTIITRVKRLLMSSIKGNNERWHQAKEAYDAYKDEIPEDKKDILETIVKYRESTTNKRKLLKDRRFTTKSKYINILFKASVLMGKF